MIAPVTRMTQGRLGKRGASQPRYQLALQILASVARDVGLSLRIMRKNIIRLSCLTAFTLGALALPVAAIADGGILVTVRIAPDHILPGLPVTFDCTVTNTSQTDVALATGVLLEVQPQTGPSFMSSQDDNLDQK